LRGSAPRRLTELRARDLSISSTEADALFQEANVRLTTRDVERLTERTEGWLAGLCLAAIVLKEHEAPGNFVNEFSGDTRAIFDYLARDVLATADPDVRGFMVHSSVLDTLSAPLCDEVLERSDSASMLAEIERSNFFLVPVDATAVEYRYHHLLADVLRRELEAAIPALFRATRPCVALV
jgi:LuxR family maltose regulon positive regulatory protein